MKKSLKTKIAVSFICLIGAAIIGIGIFHWLFIEDIYTASQQEVLIQSWEMVNTSETKTKDANRYCSMNGLTYVIADSNLNYVLSNTTAGEALINRIFGTIMGKEEKNSKLITETDDYQVLLFHDQTDNIDYLTLWGVLDSGEYYMVQSPLNLIETAASISLNFYFLIGFVVLAASVVVIWFITKGITKPIGELTELSVRMADMDFSSRYTSGGKDEIGILGENFNQMSDKLQEAVSELKSTNARLEKDLAEKIQIDDLRRDFLSNVSHELKTPIALVKGYAEVLREMQLDEENRKYYCNVIADEADKMNKLVMQLLTLNQLEYGTDTLDIQRFDIAEMIKNMVETSKPMFDTKNANIEIYLEEEPLMVWGDEFLIGEVLTNYLSNAVNHLEDPGIIRIGALIEGEKAVISVFNTGSTIPEEDLDKIWNKFYKVDKARTREYGGSGIGLSIVKAIMDLHRETYAVENMQDGVCFTFTLSLH